MADRRDATVLVSPGYEDIPGRPGPPRFWARQRTRTAVVAFAACLLALAGAAMIPQNAGLGVLAAGGAAGIGLTILNRPILAISVLLIADYFRIALKNPALPAELYLFAFAALIAGSVLAIMRRIKTAPDFRGVEGAMMLYIVYSIASGVVPHTYPASGASQGQDFTWNFIITSTVIPFMLYVVGRFVIDRESAVRTFMWVVIGLFVHAIWVSICQFAAPQLVWPRYILDIESDSGWADRAVGVFSQPVANGLILVIGFAFAIHLASQRNTPMWQRVLLYSLSTVSLYAIFLTRTRAVWLIFGLLLVVGVVMFRRSRVYYSAVLAAIAVVIIANWSSFTGSDRSAGGVGSSHEVDDRLNMIATAWWAIKEKPIFGWGITRFDQVNTYHHLQWSPSVDWIRGYGIVSHFNDIGIAAELGIVGLLLWWAVLALLVRRLIQTIRTLPREGTCGRDLAVLALVCIGMWVVTGFTADLRFFDFAGFVVLLLAGVAVGFADRMEIAADPAADHPVTEDDDWEYIRMLEAELDSGRSHEVPAR